jgi:RNA polymerase sigma factor (sigma-70 family)
MAVSDRELWRRAAGGEGEAFGELYDRHANAIYNYCYRRSADWALAEDLTASVFLEAWRKRRRVTFDREDAVLPWLYAVAGNVLRNHSRGHRRLVRFVGELALRQPPVVSPPDRVAEETELRAILQEVGRLPRREQDVLALCVFADLSYEQAALALGIPIGTVRSRLARARNRLGELLPERGHGNADGPATLPRTSV